MGEEVLQVTLRGLGDIAEGEEEEFTHELMVPEEESRGFVERSFFVRPRVNRLTDKTMPLEFDILFEPLRPFSTTVELVVNKKSGGRWRFEVQLEASEPEVDDVITIEAALHRTSSVSFKIQNQFDTYAPFSAEFSSNSSLAFTVFPSTGTLEPYGNEGQECVISFTPTEYGKMQTGNLVIVTDDSSGRTRCVEHIRSTRYRRPSQRFPPSWSRAWCKDWAEAKPLRIFSGQT